MSQSLVIVESPAKAKTINHYLGSGYIVKASMGHVRDLPKSKMGVDVEHDFAATYQVIPDKKKVVAELRKLAGESERIILAADPDREGEAISWHLRELIGADNPKVFRAVFNEITEEGIKKAFEHLGGLDMPKIEAQQTRRILDRLVGYLISPLLWKKIGRGLSAGRVQSVALRLICDREKEIRAFVAEEFWNISARLRATNPPEFKAALAKIDGKKAKVENRNRPMPSWKPAGRRPSSSTRSRSRRSGRRRPRPTSRARSSRTRSASSTTRSRRRCSSPRSSTKGCPSGSSGRRGSSPT